ncbi:tetratricopeptide repeat protein [Celerinatantimonas diazotrophica]|uniref:Sel1 repeat-containing protein n=1 Tax=Celerinatantimonas diazotrophica TaxID=412034 RepID=A0A4R1KDL7_9GAMM|nr:sel1 repeat family protein [Celerinatantimonas diazotrophica]TCK62706.1 hypothetical protein EV690_0371 [Celerinatantimonas diazotrophica]CAG9298335.1 hypothetical protein CEDIAZO_03535 [Celerinatantimonas diazotrophica]
MQSKCLKIAVLLCFTISFPLQAKLAIHNGLDALWHHQYKKAEQVFSQLAEQGNAHAMYWLGNTYQLEGGMKRLDAGRILLRAAQMGDPWAMYRLTPDNGLSFCTIWPCSSKWKSKAVEGWEKLSRQGNGKATFSLMFHKEDTYWYQFTRWIPGMGQEKLNQMALKAFHQGYLGASFYLARYSKTHDFKYIIQAAKKGFVPAYRVLSVYYRKTDNIKLSEMFQKKALQSGETTFISVLFHTYLNGGNGYDRNIDKAYYYGKISSFYGEDVSGFFRADKTSKDFSLSTRVAKDKQIVFTQKAKEFVRTHPPYHYYDEFSFPFDVMKF